MGLRRGLGGYVRLALTGIALEEVINRAIGEELAIWNITRTRADAATLDVSLGDLRKLLKIIRVYHGWMHIEARHGLPFLLAKIKRRKGLVVGAALFFVLAYLATTFVWSYEVVGNERFSEAQLIAIIQSYGVLPGVSLHNIDYSAVEKQLLLDYAEDLGWADISHKGTRVVIKVQERSPLEARNDRPAHLVAKKDGVVKEILVMQGIARVQGEQSVHKGDVLIAGIAYDRREKQEDGAYDWSGLPHLIRAKGIVQGVVEYQATGVCPLAETVLQETGQSKKNVELFIGDKTYHLWGDGLETPFAIFRQESHTKRLFAWQDYTAWIWRRTIYLEQEPQRIERTLEEAYQEAVVRAREKVAAQVGMNSTFLEEDIAVVEAPSPEVVQVEVTWRVLENMATPQFIINKQ